MHLIAEESLDGLRGRGARGHEVRQRSDDGSLAELIAILEQLRGRRREPHAIALEPLESVHLPLQRGPLLLGVQPLGARGALACARRIGRAACRG